MDETTHVDTIAIRTFLVRLARQSQRIDVRCYEECPEKRLVPHVIEILDSTIELLDGLIDRYDHSDATLDGKEQTDDSSRKAHQLVDLAYVARFELVSRREQLETSLAAEKASRRELLYLSECGLHRILHTAAALESALCELAGWKSDLVEDGHVTAALHLRGAYAEFRRRALAGDDPEDELDLPIRLRQAVREIDRLVSSEAAYVRFSDRSDLLQLRERITAWLDGNTSPLEGRRLWQDFAGFVQLLRMINHRAELVEHDRRVVEEALERLMPTERRPETIPFELFDRLRSLFGRDAELEDLITSGCKRTRSWLRPLERLRRELEVPPVLSQDIN